MTSILQQWQPRLSWCVWRSMRVPIMVWQKVIICCVDAGGFCTFSGFSDSCRDNWELNCFFFVEGETIVESGYASWHANQQITFSFLTLCHSLALLLTASPPNFSKSPLKALLKARSGSEVTLECKPEAWPPAISLWKKGNEILPRTER